MNVHPAPDAVVSPPVVILTVSPFADPDPQDVHTSSRWLVWRNDEPIGVPVYDSGETAKALTSISVPLSLLQADSIYHWQARFKDSRGGWSSFSLATSFTTPKDSDPPETLIRYGPDEGSFIGTKSPYFSWEGTDFYGGDLSFSYAIDSMESWSSFEPSSYKILNGLTDGPHFFTVRAKDASGNIDPTPAIRNFTVDTTPPELSNISVSQITSHSALVTWSTSEPASSQVSYGYSMPSESTTPVDTNAVTVHSVTLENLRVDTTVRFAVQSRDRAGNPRTSEEMTFRTTPVKEAAPPETTLVRGPEESSLENPREVAFAWTGSDDCTPTANLLYAFRLDNDPWSSFAAATSWTAYSLTDGWHTFAVKARDQSGKEDQTPAVRSFQVDAIPPSPASDFRSWVTQTGAELQWVPSPSPDTQAYRLFWDKGLGVLDYVTAYATIPHPGSALSIVLPNRGTYRFALRAVDRVGNEEKNTHLVTTVALTRPNVPTLKPVTSPTLTPVQVLSGTKDAQTSLSINGIEVTPLNDSTGWSYEASLAVGLNRFEIACRSTTGELSPSVVASIEYDALPLPVTTLKADGIGSGASVSLSWAGYDEASQKDIASYRVYAAEQPFSQIGGMAPRATLPRATFQYTASNLLRGKTYYFAVVAFDVRGNVNTAVTPVAVVPRDVMPPEPPTGLRVDCFSDRLLFSWSQSANSAGDLAGYKVYFNGSATPVSIEAAQTTYEPTGLSAATSYPIKVTAYDSSENESSPLSANGITLIENPGGVTAQPFSGKVTLTWTDAQPRAYVSEYRVYVSESPFVNVAGMMPKAKTTGAIASVAGLTNDTPYHFAVTTVNLSGGERKAVATVTTTPQGDKEGPVVSDLRFENAPVANGATIRTSGTFSVSAADPSGMSRVELAVDGVLRHTDTNGSTRYSYYLNIVSVEDGSHVLNIKAFDTLGNSSTVSLSFDVVTQPPGAPILTSPTSGTLTSKETVTVTGRADKGTEVLLYGNNVQVGNATPADANGNFTTSLTLTEGQNRIQAAARNRGGVGPRSGEILVTLDSTLPNAPLNLTAELHSGGTVRLSWRAPQEGAIRGYNLYRAEGFFDSTAGAVKVNTGPITATSYENLPPFDGAYSFRATTVDLAGNESEFSNAASIAIDRTPPRAASIQYVPTGPYDPATGRIGVGLVNVRLTVTEPLLLAPFLSMTPQGGAPITVDLTKGSDLEYTGVFAITDSTPSGTAYAVFSARDLAGNRGTEIDSGAGLLIDASGPSVSQLSIQPAQPVKNDEHTPVSLTVTSGLNEPVQAGTTPELVFLLSGQGRTPAPIHSVAKTATLPGQAETYQATFSLPADAGLARVESLEFRYRGMDDLGNVSTRVLCENRFQIYQGDLPPLDAPQGFTAKVMPQGKVRLSWQAVPGAVGYELYRKGPGEDSLTALIRTGNVIESVDATPADGKYTYAVSSVRRENGQEAVSALSAQVEVESDSAPPNEPSNLALELISRGINAAWQPPHDLAEPVTYSLYRADMTEILTVVGMTPIIKGVKETTVLDPKPSATDHCYVVTAVDAAGNESAPSNSFYLNFGLLPVSTLKVVQNGSNAPVLSWTPPPGSSSATVSGYNVEISSAGSSVKLNGNLLTTPSFTDTGYAGDERCYTVTAVDDNGIASLGRSITLPVLQATLKEGEMLKRGVMNRLEYTVSNSSPSRIEHARLKVVSGAHSGLSEEFQVPERGSLTVPVSFGGYADLPDVARITTTLSIAPSEGELVEISRAGDVAVVDGMLRLQILNEAFTRGATGRVRFVLENTGEEEIEILTATSAGASPSTDITFTLRDLDGNVLSSKGYRQILGEDIVTLANKNTVARIASGATFTSEPVELAVPLTAPAAVRVEMAVKNVYYRRGRPEQVTMQGLSSRHELTLVDTSYSGAVTAVSPEVSNGDQDISISGYAMDRASGQPVAQAPLRLVISVNGFERTSTVHTDASGIFTFIFKPLPLESGQYKVFAVHPDVLDKPAQATFIVNRLSITPQTMNLNIPKNFQKEVVVQVSAGDGTDLHNVHLACEASDQPGGAFPEGVHLTVGSHLTALGSKQTGTLGFSVWADNTADPTTKLVLRVKSDEKGDGSWGTVTVNLQCSESQPVLFFNPNHLETGVAYGGAATETVTLENRGLAEMSDVTLALASPDGSPAPAWVSLNSEPSQGNIAVGEKKPVTVSFAPTAETAAEGVYTFYVRVSSANYRRTDIPVSVTVTQSGVGSALFKVSDIYTGTVNAKGQIIQGLSGASITVQHEQVLTIQRTLSSDSLGEAMFTALPSGRYKVRIAANNHQEHIGRLWIKPGITLDQSVFLEYNLVTVEWQVVETTIQDRYEIVLKATYETNVPAPVVVAEPSSVSLPQMKAGDVYHGEFTLTNYGLIRADTLQFALPNGGDSTRYELLTPIPASLDAKQRVTVPFRVTCLRSFNPAEDGQATGGGCEVSTQCGRITYTYRCASGSTSSGGYPYCVITRLGDCTASSSPPGSPGTGSGSGSTWDYTYPGGSGTVGPTPTPSPKPIEGVKCWPKPDRKESSCETGHCPPENEQDVSQNVASSVHLVLREYNDRVTDLAVKAPGGAIHIERLFYDNAWRFEHLRHNLVLTLDSLGQTVKSIEKGGVIYERAGTGGATAVYVHETYTITQRADGYLWQDKFGNWKRFDLRGRMVSYGLPTGTVGKLLYETAANGKVLGIADRNDDQVIWFEYDANGRLRAVRDATGRCVEYGYTNARLSSVNDVLGNSSSYEYNANGRLTKKTDPEGHSTVIKYDPYGNVSGVVDAAGATTSFQFDYDDSRKEYYAQVKFPSGMIKEVWYDRFGETRRVDINGKTTRKIIKDGRNLLITDERGFTTRKDRDEWNNVTRVLHPDGTQVSYEYARPLNRRTKAVDERGIETLFSYDETGNLLRKTEAAGSPEERVTRYTYDDNGNLLTVTREGNAVTRDSVATMEYDAKGNNVGATDGEGNVTQATHDVMGNALTLADANRNEWLYEFDAAGRLLSIRDPSGNTSTFEYDKLGHKVKEVDAENKEKRFAYDAMGRLVRSTNGAGDTTTFTYNVSGLLTCQTDPEGKSIRYEYDQRERLAKTIDGSGNETRFEYEESSGCSSCTGSTDRPRRVIYPTFTKEFEYDSRGRKTAERDVLSETEAYVTTFRYDVCGNLTSTTDKEGKTAGTTYDALNRPILVTDAMGHETRYAYDARGNLVSLTDANGNTTRFTHDRNNRQTSETRPMGEITSYAYDGVGSLVRKVDAKNQEIQYQYEPTGQLVQVLYFEHAGDATPIKTVLFAYDRTGHLTGYDDGTTTGSYSYDDAYRKIAESVDYGPFTLSSQTAWYGNGAKKSFTGPDGITYDYAYDGNNQLTSIAIPGQGFITYNTYSWTRPTLITYPGGTTRELTYDPLMRTKSITVRDPAQNVLMDYHYQHDRMGNITTKVTEHGEYTYDYDDLYRLTNVQDPNQSNETYTYDPLGNRLTSAGIYGTWIYNDNNGLKAYDDVTFTQDANGNTIRKMQGLEVTNYIYDIENRQVQVQTASGKTIATYYHDPFGRRLWKDISGTRTHFFYTDEGLIGEYNSNGIEFKSYGYTPESKWTRDPLLMKVNFEYYYYQNDRLGTPMQMTTTTGDSVWSSKYSPFGSASILQKKRIVSNLRFPGQYQDEETNLYYNYHRIYDPKIGLYLQTDPAGLGHGLNLYQYANSNPNSFYDSYGLWLGGGHEDLTRKAWTGITYPSEMGNYSSLILDAIVANNLAVDTGSLKTINSWHFNRSIGEKAEKAILEYSNTINTSWNLIHIAMLNPSIENCGRSLILFGHLTHAWQDYYAHAIPKNPDALDLLTQVVGPISGTPNSIPENVIPSSWNGLFLSGEHDWVEPGWRATDCKDRYRRAEQFTRDQMQVFIKDWWSGCHCYAAGTLLGGI